jgi:hypothetical protein
MISVRYGVLTVALLAIGGCAPATYSQQGYMMPRPLAAMAV